MENEEVLATIRPSSARRGFGLIALGLLGLILIYVAFAQPPSDLGWQLFLVIFRGRNDLGCGCDAPCDGAFA